MADAPKRAGAAKRASPGRVSSAASPRTPLPPPVEAAAPVVRAAVPEPAAKPGTDEPVWLVRVVLVLFLIGFAAFLAREVYSFVQSLP